MFFSLVFSFDCVTPAVHGSILSSIRACHYHSAYAEFSFMSASTFFLVSLCEPARPQESSERVLLDFLVRTDSDTNLFLRWMAVFRHKRLGFAYQMLDPLSSCPKPASQELGDCISVSTCMPVSRVTCLIPPREIPRQIQINASKFQTSTTISARRNHSATGLQVSVFV